MAVTIQNAITSKRSGSNPACIVGICDSQDAGAVLLGADGKLSAVNEERLSRVKQQGGFPERSVRTLLAMHRIPPEAVTAVAVASCMTPAFFFRCFPGAHQRARAGSRQFSTGLAAYIAYQSVLHKSRIGQRFEAAASRSVLGRRLKALGISAPVSMIEHHQAHAWAAYGTCGFDTALVITIDGLGDGLSFTVSIGSAGKLRRVFAQSAWCDITLYYSRLTEFLGYRPIQDEGKVMGLAGFSRSEACIPHARKLLRVCGKRFAGNNPFYRVSADRHVFRALSGYAPTDIAAGFQQHVEESIAALVHTWVQATGIRSIALAGGFFANIKVNQRIAELPDVDRVYVFPHMGDGGLAMGAVCAMLSQPIGRLEHLFLGPDYPRRDIETVLRQEKAVFTASDHIENDIAQLLHRGKAVARFDGALEYGPRALGNRSILAPGRDSRIAEMLNEKLSRDSCMPFAPAVLEEYAADCCAGLARAPEAAAQMTMSFKATDYLSRFCPAAVHCDRTARPQVVSRLTSPGLHRILDAYRALSTVPAVINTSFNMHNEPIVCSPQQALQSFYASGLDYLAIGDYMVRQPEAPACVSS